MRPLLLVLGALVAIAVMTLILWPSPPSDDPAHAVKPGSGESFRDTLAEGGDCAFCPEMVVVPPGRYVMGWPTDIDNPQMDNFFEELEVPVRIRKAFAVGKFELTFDEWDACLADGGCLGHRPDDYGWGRGKRPVIDVSFEHAKAYVDWLSRKTGRLYRLLSEAEWEYAARAGTATPFWWGESIAPRRANYVSTQRYAGGGETGEPIGKTVAVDSYEPNPWGLYNVHGNVREWTEDCWNFENQTNPGDGSARLTGACEERVVRNGGWDSEPAYIRVNNRNRQPIKARWNDLGFRIARDLGR